MKNFFIQYKTLQDLKLKISHLFYDLKIYFYYRKKEKERKKKPVKIICYLKKKVKFENYTRTEVSVHKIYYLTAVFLYKIDIKVDSYRFK